jgi:hypothetical protein
MGKYFIVIRYKKNLYASKLLGYIKTFETKKCLKMFYFYFLYSVKFALCGSRQKFLAD